MRVEVTPANIDAYGLDIITGNTRMDLLARAAEAHAEGNVMHVVIPDVVGGDTEAPVDRNIFEHYTDVPDPDGRSHEQAAIDLSQACSYSMYQTVDGNVFVCNKHGVPSKHAVDAESHAPCLVVDDY